MYLKKIALYGIIMMYLVAGVNHFWHPSFYLRLIPPYLPYHSFINYASGVAELVLGLMIAFANSRRAGVIGIIILLISFIPSHVYSLQIACPGEDGCAMQWIAWIRFFIIHPVLIAWAWWIRDAVKQNLHGISLK
jgi:uncharacterized membrane protein